jgi:glycosyltransferase involved in cell wall biosynthesis
VRVAYTLEQCWHRVPGGTAVAALRVAQALQRIPDIELVEVAGRHRHVPPPPWRPSAPVAQLPIGSPWLYETWLRFGLPNVERATGRVDVAHATTIIPCASAAPLVVTVHDLAFLHEPDHFTRHGVRVFRSSLSRIRQRAALVLCSSQATIDDCATAGIAAERLRLVPLGVDASTVGEGDVDRVRATYALPERFLLFVGTVEPRKNLSGLAAAIRLLDEPLPLVVAGAAGWGDVSTDPVADVRFLGFVPDGDLGALYATAEVCCYPSLREGYGLPVLEAMAHGVPVVTSRGTSTEEAAGGAAVLVDPLDPADIARGITEARRDRADLVERGSARAASQSWARTAALTAAAYREIA